MIDTDNPDLAADRRLVAEKMAAAAWTDPTDVCVYTPTCVEEQSVQNRCDPFRQVRYIRSRGWRVNIGANLAKSRGERVDVSSGKWLHVGTHPTDPEIALVHALAAALRAEGGE